MKINRLLLGLALSLSSHSFAKSMLAPISEADCQNDYLSLMADSEINFTIAYGYFDHDNGTTSDVSKRDKFIKTMSTPCTVWHSKTCGYKATGTNPTVLTRKMTGPDGLIKTIRITVDAPSLSTTDKTNRENPQQKVRSDAVKKMYLDGLRNSEVTIYLGHSRDGGGPDFDPPKKKADGHTDYDAYHANPKDKKEVMTVLKEDPNKSRIVAFFSCSSIRWFSNGVSTGAPGTGFIGTDDSFVVTDFKQVYPFIEKILSFQCVDKLVVPDEHKTANAKTQKKWKIPTADQNITKADLTKKTIEKLAAQLYSQDKEVRQEAYREIKSYDTKYYTQKVWTALNDYRAYYTFGNVLN